MREVYEYQILAGIQYVILSLKPAAELAVSFGVHYECMSSDLRRPNGQPAR